MALRAKHVLGVEIVPESVESAVENAKLNNLSNCDFVCGDVFQVLEKTDLKPEKINMKSEKINPKADNINQESEKTDFLFEKRGLKPDVIVVDPPRVGMSTDTVNKIASYGVKQLVYISCNPKTLVKNLVQFESLGYEVKYVKPYDNFPFTRHVEVITLLSKLDSKRHISVELPIDELDLTSAESKATYAQIKEYILEKFNLKVSTLYIAQIKKKCGIVLREHYNKSKKEKQVIPQCTPEKEDAIMDALRHFKMI